ncbi:NAD(P)-dependent oxidoreductase [Streptomyces sp. NPDC006553]|uniref:NAD-dependent epimerase/dehydratase family protein n=1 Tax=Streptomyces sp. NPDC006553 TaxID=3157180 RepID=UPI0033BFA6DB
MNVVLLGAGGFLGAHLHRGLTDAGHRVVSFAGTGAGGLDLASAAPGRIAAAVADALGDPDGTDHGAVVNAAGRAWNTDEAGMRAGNAELPARVVRALALLARPPRLVQLGTVHEYGAGTSGTPTPETTPPAPVTPYGRTKLLGTEAVLAAAGTGRVPGTVLRIANVAGPGAPTGSLLGSVAARLTAVAHALHAAPDGGAGRTPVELRLPPLRAWRDFVDVRDVTDAVLRTLTAPLDRVSGRVINIGGGAAVHTRELVQRLVDLSGLPVRTVEETVPGAPARHDTEWQQLDITRAAELLGWHPGHSLDHALRDLLAASSASNGTAGRTTR